MAKAILKKQYSKTLYKIQKNAQSKNNPFPYDDDFDATEKEAF